MAQQYFALPRLESCTSSTCKSLMPCSGPQKFFRCSKYPDVRGFLYKKSQKKIRGKSLTSEIFFGPPNLEILSTSLLLGVVNVLSYKVDLAFEEWSYWTESFWTLPPHKWFMIEYWMWRITIFYIKKWNLKKVLKLCLKRWNFYIEGPLCFFNEWNDWFPKGKVNKVKV